MPYTADLQKSQKIEIEKLASNLHNIKPSTSSVTRLEVDVFYSFSFFIITNIMFLQLILRDNYLDNSNQRISLLKA